MPLLPLDLLSRLPQLGCQRDQPDPIVYARLYLPGTSWNFYVIEGGIEAGFWVLYCFYQADGKFGFSPFPLDLLEALRSPDGQALTFDPEFPQGQLTEVVPAPEI